MATENTIVEITELLFAASLANKPKNIPATTKVFALTLRDIDDDLLKAATVNHVAREKWFPAPADLRQSAADLLETIDDTPDSYAAWEQVKRKMRGGPDLHPLAQKAIDSLGGFREFGLSDVGDESSWRARFIMAYDQYRKRDADTTMMLPLVAGYIEKRKELNGQSVSELMDGLTRKLTAQ